MTRLSSIDQMGNLVELANPPTRIISLVPSQTELLFDLGLEDRVVGITKFCVHPDHWRRSKGIIGGTKNFQMEVIDQLRPDLIIGNKEENYPEGISKLQQRYPVWLSDITTFADALQMVHLVSELTNAPARGAEIVENIDRAFEKLKPFPTVEAMYLMWRNPWMGAANGTFINSMMKKIGLVNVLDGRERYPELSAEMISELAPSAVLLSSEPYPFAEKHIEEIHEILPAADVQLVDGEMFSWYGSRLARAPAYFSSLKF